MRVARFRVVIPLRYRAVPSTINRTFSHRFRRHA